MHVDRDPSRFGRQSTMRNLVLLRSMVFITLAAIVVGGCGEESGGELAAAGDVERYCRAVQELDIAFREVFDGPRSVTEQDADELGRELLDENAELIDDLVDAAPIEIREDVQLQFNADPQDLEPDTEISNSMRSAVDRIDAFQDAHCEEIWMLPPEIAEGSNPYCEAVRAVVVMPEATVRSDRPQYRAAIAATVAASPDQHRSAWQTFLTFVDDNSSENFNPAANALDDIAPGIREDCQINLVLDDWDLLRHFPMTDRPGVYVES